MNYQIEVDDLLDHIYEYGTISEGVSSRVIKLAKAIEKQVLLEVRDCRTCNKFAIQHGCGRCINTVTCTNFSHYTETNKINLSKK